MGSVRGENGGLAGQNWQSGREVTCLSASICR